jgi:hypothetical protein
VPSECRVRTFSWPGKPKCSKDKLVELSVFGSLLADPGITGRTPANVKKGKRGLVEWQEVALDTIKTITFTPTSIGTTVAGSTAASPVPQEFATYSDGTRLAVYLSEVVTAR